MNELDHLISVERTQGVETEQEISNIQKTIKTKTIERNKNAELYKVEQQELDKEND